MLGDYNALKLRRFNGDYAASDILIDLATAIKWACLTDRQRQALRLVYVEDLTQADAGARMGGLARDAVNHLLDRAIDAIAEVYWYWSRHGEGYSVGTTKGDADNGESGS